MGKFSWLCILVLGFLLLVIVYNLHIACSLLVSYVIHLHCLPVQDDFFPLFFLNLQYVEVVPQMEKQRRLEQILRAQEPGSKVIIFCSTKKLCDQLARSIGRNFGATAIHGDKSQGERDWVLNQFRSGKSPVLVATDVAARGLDIKDIRLACAFRFLQTYLFNVLNVELSRLVLMITRA